MARWPNRYSGKGPLNGQDPKARDGKPWRCKKPWARAFRNYESTTDPVTAFTTNSAGASW